MTASAFEQVEINLLAPVVHTITCTGKSLSEAFILASTNPQYEKRLFIELQV